MDNNCPKNKVSDFTEGRDINIDKTTIGRLAHAFSQIPLKDNYVDLKKITEGEAACGKASPTSFPEGDDVDSFSCLTPQGEKEKSVKTQRKHPKIIMTTYFKTVNKNRRKYDISLQYAMNDFDLHYRVNRKYDLCFTLQTKDSKNKTTTTKREKEEKSGGEDVSL